MNMYNVTFFGDYVTLTTCVTADSEESSEEIAKENMKNYYGWDMDSFGIETELEGVFQ